MDDYERIPIGTVVRVVRKDVNDEWWVDRMDMTIGHEYVVIDNNGYDEGFGDEYICLDTSRDTRTRCFIGDYWYHINDLEIIEDKCDFDTDEVFDMRSLI